MCARGPRRLARRRRALLRWRGAPVQGGGGWGLSAGEKEAVGARLMLARHGVGGDGEEGVRGSRGMWGGMQGGGGEGGRGVREDDTDFTFHVFPAVDDFNIR